MSDERFDKLIKKNLESVRPAYEARAWERFRQRLPAIGFWAGVAAYGGWVLSGLMLAGWLTTLYTLRENQQLMKQLTQQVARPVQPEAGAEVTFGSGQAIDRQVDTVYIVKQTVVEDRHSYALSGGLLGSGPATGKSLGPVLTQDEQQHRPINPAPAQTKNGHPNALPDPTNPADSISRVIAEATVAIPVEPTQPESTGVNSSPKQADAAPLSVSATSATQAPATQSPPRFRLATLQPRVGIETRAAANGIGVGLVLELFPMENLGLSVGLIASQLQGENHRELRDFNSATGREFIEQYRAYLPAQYDQIRDIEVQTALISLPVSISYYLPLRKRWSLLFQTGTSFDLDAYQQVNYESYFKGDDRYNSFEIDTKPRFFHNFMFGTGVQYRRRRLSAQLSPYYLYDFRSLPNTPKGSNVGVRASVWLNLFNRANTTKNISGCSFGNQFLFSFTLQFKVLYNRNGNRICHSPAHFAF